MSLILPDEELEKIWGRWITDPECREQYYLAKATVRAQARHMAREIVKLAEDQAVAARRTGSIAEAVHRTAFHQELEAWLRQEGVM
jgi:cob(I)alamin adenosyltransferase